MPPVVIGGVIAATGAIGGAVIASNGAKSAANAQAASNAQAIAAQQAQYKQTRKDLSPWMNTGEDALQSQAALLGLSGSGQQKLAIQRLQASPLYQSLFTNGQNTLLANASATGGLRTGNTNDALAQFGRDTLAQVIENQLSNLGGVSSLGENAGALVGNAGSNSANSISSLLNNTGAAQGNAAYTSAGSMAGAVNSLSQIASGLFKSSSPNANLLSSVQQTVADNPSIF